MTPDERFLIKASQLASAKGDFQRPVNFITVGKAIGMKESAGKNTIKLLAKANFILKIDDLMITVTERGQNHVNKLLGLH
jgi:Mn-dependent DtxR family transcriptional regulator